MAETCCLDVQTDAYYLCGEGEYALMLYCDAENCPVGWYHAECVGLTQESVPDGCWYCPKCCKS